jgi:hypothetical protein
MLTTEPLDGGTMSRVREEGKSDFVGSLGRVAIFVYQTLIAQSSTQLRPTSCLFLKGEYRKLI